ncbi:endo-1,3(4)-beta-glucanase [Endogone sp. FLAS-F59071]|nr:endo-1,3(4)-beta-glucanase [Endogone sp. FLAS-F59071]|eukprot:RUS16641.1 endo-1,3(4)-beta-glucanase [Endogone sp. FLAS-F59071]
MINIFILILLIVIRKTFRQYLDCSWSSFHSVPMQVPPTSVSPIHGSQKKLRATNTIFGALSTSAPPSTFGSVSHPYPPQYNSPSFNALVPTNSWISNLFYASTNNAAPTLSEPYIIHLMDMGLGGNPGLSIRQPSNKVQGSYPPTNNVPASNAGYYINSFTVDLRFTANEWSSVTPTQSVTYWDLFSATVKLGSGPGSITFPISRGMAYVTAKYSGLTPQFYSQNAILSINGAAPSGWVSGNKFKLAFNDSSTSTYIIYVLGSQILTLGLSSTQTLTASSIFTGTIRIAKLPSASDAESVLDDRKNVYTMAGTVSASFSASMPRTSGSYQFQWTVVGDDGKGVLTYALLHHQQSIDTLSVTVTDLSLVSGTHGPMQAVIGNTWTLDEVTLSSTTWLPSNPVPYPGNVNTIISALQADTSSDYTAQTLLSDNYFSGKGLQKFALLALILNCPETRLNDSTLAATALDKLKAAFLPFLDNQQPDSFRYDTTYGGIIALSGLPASEGGTGNAGAAFGHSYYNDHHYHQGYLIVTAAIIKYLDPNWKTAQLEAWAEALIRDVNNSSTQDTYFPVFRYFDWFVGHSWAGGISINGALDGRNQESVSELCAIFRWVGIQCSQEVNFFWGAKLYALAKGNSDYANLCSLQLSINKRAIYNYFWMLDDNAVQPSWYVQNKVVGILFENKCDYTTYFGRYLEYIHGIQQLPMTPILGEESRTATFVQQEWTEKLDSIICQVTSGWEGVLYTNYAIINPAQAYDALQNCGLDDGLTRSWALYFASTRPDYNPVGTTSVSTTSTSTTSNAPQSSPTATRTTTSTASTSTLVTNASGGYGPAPCSQSYNPNM